MAMGRLFNRYKVRVEEIRLSQLSPEELNAEEFQRAQDRVEEAHLVLEELKQEWVTMDEKHYLSMNGFTLVIGKYSPGEPDQVLCWWKDYCQRSHEAQVEFNNALSQWAGLKGQN